MGFLHELAYRDTFWSTAALGQVTLMIALVLEARTAQENYEAKYATLMLEQAQWEAALKAAQEPKSFFDSNPQPSDPAIRRRLTDAAIAMAAVALLAVGTVVALLALLPLEYLGSGWVIAGLTIEAICIIFGLGGLVAVMFRRIVNVPSAAEEASRARSGDS